MYFERADNRACNKALFFTWLWQSRKYVRQIQIHINL